ncbi:MmcQ/YjbR family DNA-binding protein [Sphingomonas ginkgonis]|uniref:MmcQ/YjbR family DNA-binding protein n=1 Tax=Sphingomonas ginkgonis TaxID=2315330 RepID=A0A429VCV4_9SPHN|nr:MmcQ/YjbR family DNA-binding protein [Sphingomonas ginkgonis]RST31830.1 MmcQ/YjbR family DNA-binding protein [Sphingomonas ginkgonis]
MFEAVDRLFALGLTWPAVTRKSPWPGHDDLAVNGKTFAYLPARDGPFRFIFKLPYTGSEVLDRPDSELPGYGLGRAGWVTIRPSADAMPSFEQLCEWMEESYRAQAPRRLVKMLDAEGE